VHFYGYALTQFPALARYVALSFWPHPLIFEYGPFTVERVADIAWSGLLGVALILGTLYALWRKPKLHPLA